MSSPSGCASSSSACCCSRLLWLALLYNPEGLVDLDGTHQTQEKARHYHGHHFPGSFPHTPNKKYPVPLGRDSTSAPHTHHRSHGKGNCPEGLDRNFTRQTTGKTRHLGVFSRHNRVFARHKQMSSPSGCAPNPAADPGRMPRGTRHLFVTAKDPVMTGKHAQTTTGFILVF